MFFLSCPLTTSQVSTGAGPLFLPPSPLLHPAQQELFCPTPWTHLKLSRGNLDLRFPEPSLSLEHLPNSPSWNLQQQLLASGTCPRIVYSYPVFETKDCHFLLLGKGTIVKADDLANLPQIWSQEQWISLKNSLLRVRPKAELPRATLADAWAVANLAEDPDTPEVPAAPLDRLESWPSLLARASSLATAPGNAPSSGRWDIHLFSLLLPLWVTSGASSGIFPTVRATLKPGNGAREAALMIHLPAFCTSKVSTDPSAGRAWRSGAWIVKTSIKVQNVLTPLVVIFPPFHFVSSGE